LVGGPVAFADEFVVEDLAGELVAVLAGLQVRRVDRAESVGEQGRATVVPVVGLLVGLGERGDIRRVVLLLVVANRFQTSGDLGVSAPILRHGIRISSWYVDVGSLDLRHLGVAVDRTRPLVDPVSVRTSVEQLNRLDPRRVISQGSIPVDHSLDLSRRCVVIA
jgi:hypothetical protein